MLISHLLGIESGHHGTEECAQNAGVALIGRSGGAAAAAAGVPGGSVVAGQRIGRRKRVKGHDRIGQFLSINALGKDKNIDKH